VSYIQEKDKELGVDILFFWSFEINSWIKEEKRNAVMRTKKKKKRKHGAGEH
jgi:hypothetical protein